MFLLNIIPTSAFSHSLSFRCFSYYLLMIRLGLLKIRKNKTVESSIPWTFFLFASEDVNFLFGPLKYIRIFKTKNHPFALPPCRKWQKKREAWEFRKICLIAFQQFFVTPYMSRSSRSFQEKCNPTFNLIVNKRIQFTKQKCIYNKRNEKQNSW